ncbi:MAG: putative membrane protein YedE/YeeE [Parasphingorhabdus sp.]|jgi:uncharacterized membrane protein YedE/YeeE
MFNFVYFLSGILFSLGLGVSGMTNPENILVFLNVVGEWRADLIIVMAAAVGTYLTGYLLTTKSNRPLLAEKFQLPTSNKIDLKLVTGAVLFGIGWGLAGFCPGPALVTLVTGNVTVIVFVISMSLGMFLWQMIESGSLSAHTRIIQWLPKTG